MSDKPKLSSIPNSIFFAKLREAQQRPDLKCFVYIVPQNHWVAIENIIALSRTSVTHTFDGEMDDIPCHVEETFKIDMIKHIRLGKPNPNEQEIKEKLENTYTNATANKED